jgi:hypothetical protein
VPDRVRKLPSSSWYFTVWTPLMSLTLPKR